MIEPRSNATADDGTTADVRQPFVSPQVSDMGALKELTLVGGSL